MPPGAKKRKALKKKQQGQGENSNGFNGDNLHGDDEQGGQDDRKSDSTLSSQGNEEFAVTKHPSASISSALVVKETAKEISDVTQGLGPKRVNGVAVGRGTGDKNSIVEDSHISSSGNSTQTAKNVDLKVISEKGEHAETSTHSYLVKQMSDEKKKYQSMEKDNGKVATAAGTIRKVESVRESEAPVSSEEKRLLLLDPQAVRTSWLSCCGLFDAVTGSDR